MRTINCSLTVGSPRDRGCRAGWFTGSLTSKWFIQFAVALFAMAVLSAPAFAQAAPNTCLQNEYNSAAGLPADSTSQSNALNCTAGDVKIAQVSNVRDPATGKTLSSCILGSTFNFIADFQVVTTAKSTRSNIGMYIATNSTTQALTGSCDD